ncbi:rho-related protein racA-like [Symsagittifera roscoffensis]|uniref:rho-related protein racA-like n=1 Tax=Symsagittifera roscoffensis TaxID=84072 RepID=UPI00307B1496
MGEEVTIVVVGDGVVGKSCLCSMFSGNSFPDAYIPTVMDVSHGSVMVDGKKVRVEIQDTAGSDDFDRIRQLQYPKANAFVIVFAIDARTSFENVKIKWAPEIKHAAPGKPFILVGNKSDLRGTEEALVTTSEGQARCTEIGAQLYMETSALRNTNVHNLFAEAVKMYKSPKKKRGKKQKTCLIL